MIAIDGILDQHVAPQVGSVDRVYLNLYVARLQQPGGIYIWLREARGLPIPSPAMLGKIDTTFVKEVERYARDHAVPLMPFPRGVRKEEYVRPYFEAANAEGRSGASSSAPPRRRHAPVGCEPSRASRRASPGSSSGRPRSS